jgi:hypothetical protein
VINAPVLGGCCTLGRTNLKQFAGQRGGWEDEAELQVALQRLGRIVLKFEENTWHSPLQSSSPR